MLYKAKVHLTVGMPDRSTKVFEAGKFYKESDLGKETDISNFIVMTETEAERDLAQNKQAPLTKEQKGQKTAPKGDVE